MRPARVLVAVTFPRPVLTGHSRDAAAGDQDPRPGEGGGFALEEAFRARHVDLVRLATLLLGDQAGAEDVVQDVFTRMYAQADRLAGNGVGPAYFRTAVLNACRSVHRRRVIAGRFRASAEARRWAEPVPSPEVAVLLAEDRRNVYRALVTLPRRQREALILRYYQRLSESEIAETMGISRGTVKSTLSRGLAALGRTLSKENGR